MATVYSPPLSPAQWRNTHSLNKQPSADTLSSIHPSRSKVSPMPSPPPTKSRFNISSVIRFGMKSKKNRASDIIQDPPQHLYAIPVPVPVSKLQKDSDINLDFTHTNNPRFSRGLSSISGTSRASTDGPLTPSDDLRVSSHYHHSLMSLSDTANKSSPVIRPSPFYANDKRHSAHSDKSLGKRIKERLHDDYRGGNSNRTSKLPDPATISSPRHAHNVDKLDIVRERSPIRPASHVTRSSVLADMSSDNPHFRAEANYQDMLKTPLLSPVSFQHPFVMAEAIPATLLDAHASAHPRKMSDFSSHGSFRTTVSSLSRTPTILSTSTSRSAPAASSLNFTSPIKNRFMRGSVTTYSSGPAPLSTQSSMSSLKAAASQQSKLARAPTILRPGSSSGSVSPRNDSPHPPPTTSLPPTPVELGSDTLLPDTRSLSSSSRRVPSGSAPTRLSSAASTSQSFTTVKPPPENQHLTPTISRPAAISGSAVSLSTISSLSFAARPSLYNGSQSDSRSRSASRAGSVSASIPDQGQKEEAEVSQRENSLQKGSGSGEPSSMFDMSEDTEGEEEESDIEFVDEEDILRNNGVDTSQRSPDSVSKVNLPPSESSNSTQLGNQGLSKSTSFVRALTSSTVVNVLRKQRSFHHSPASGTSNVPHPITATASTSAQATSAFPSLSASSPLDSTQSSLNPQTDSLTRSHPSSSSYLSSHAFSSSTVTEFDSNQVLNSNSTQLHSQQQQPHQSQGPLPLKSSVRALRHHTSFDPGTPGDGGGGGNGNGHIKATTANSISSPATMANNASGVNVNCTTRVVGSGTNVSDSNSMADKFGSIRVGATSPPSRTTSPHASLVFNTTGRSPATSIHSLQLQLQSSSEDAARAGAASTTTTSSAEKRKYYESRRERERKSDMSGLLLPTVAEPSDDNDNDVVNHVFPSRSETRPVPPRSHAGENIRDNASSMQLPSPKLDLAQPVLTQEEISRIGDEDTLSFRRRTKSSWGSGSASIANTYISVESANALSNSRFRSPGLMRHAISSSDLYNRANQRDGLLVVVRNEFNDGDPNFTSLPPPPRKTKVNGFSSSSGVNSFGMETGRSRGRKHSEERKDRDKGRKSSRSKSKSKSKGDENVVDDFEPSFLDMGGSGRNVRLNFEGDKEIVGGDEQYTSTTIGLPSSSSPHKSHKSSSGRYNNNHRERDCLHDIVKPIQPVYNNPYRHPYGYTEPSYSLRDLALASSSEPFSSSSYQPAEESFLELRRNHDSIIF